MSDTFTCALCGEAHEKGRPDGEALAELEAYFPGARAEDCELVCDRCWEKIKPASPCCPTCGKPLSGRCFCDRSYG